LAHPLEGNTTPPSRTAMGIALFFAAASNLRGELKVDLVVPGTRTCVLHRQPSPFSRLPKRFVFGTETRCESDGAADCIEAQNAGAGLMVRCKAAYCLGY
jgi:hypothetical protein